MTVRLRLSEAGWATGSEAGSEAVSAGAAAWPAAACGSGVGILRTPGWRDLDARPAGAVRLLPAEYRWRDAARVDLCAAACGAGQGDEWTVV